MKQTNHAPIPRIAPKQSPEISMKEERLTSLRLTKDNILHEVVVVHVTTIVRIGNEFFPLLVSERLTAGLKN
jgi:hypothetical protein